MALSAMTSGDDENKRKVLFFIYSTLIYFPTLCVIITCTTGIYIIGKSGFQPILLIIAIAEMAKHFASNVYYPRLESNKKKDSYAGSIVRIFSWARLKEGLKTLFVTAIMTAVYFMIAILFGVEILSKHKESIMFSGLLSILTVFPVCLNLGCMSFFPLFLGVRPTTKEETLLAQNIYLTLSGAWFGAMTIPLDWDRPWQVWPIPCTLAAIVGFTLSHLIMLYRMRESPRKKHKV